jgi:hypothetical protein
MHVHMHYLAADMQLFVFALCDTFDMLFRDFPLAYL